MTAPWKGLSLSSPRLFVDRDYYRERTPRSCAACLQPAMHRLRKNDKHGQPDNSSVRPICGECAPAEKAA